jgi:hypothetical protein
VSRWRRALPIAMAAMPVLFISVFGVVAFNVRMAGADLESGERLFVLVIVAAVGPTISPIGAFISAVMVPGGIVLRLMGYAVVNAAGREIGRGRSILRAGVAWSPILAWLTWLFQDPVTLVGTAPTLTMATGAVAIGTMAAGAIWTIARPTRGPVELITGTTVVVR